MQMFYKPKHCSECGEEVVRTEQRFWQSRQFCDLCATEYQVTDVFGRISVLFVPVLMIAAVAGLSGIGRVGQSRSAQESSFPKINESKIEVRSQPNPVKLKAEVVESVPNTNTIVATTKELPEQPETRRTSSDDRVFYCGAPTKKGTPCSRRVKVSGYCWQHRKQAE
jgi:hypothetical protein